MEKKIYGAPEIKISNFAYDIITQSKIEDYTEGEEWTGPEIDIPMGGI